MRQTAVTLNDRFAIENCLCFAEHNSGLIVANVSSEKCKAEFFLHGAHVTGFQPTGESEVLFLSREAVFGQEKAIRGGIPICFPWFAANANAPDKPSHGYARIREWEMIHSSLTADGIVIVELQLKIEPFSATYRIEMGSELRCEMRVTNGSDQAVSFEAALHSYFQLSDVRQVELVGLEVSSFLDQLTDQTCEPEQGPIQFTCETDRIYLGTEDSVTIVDAVAKRKIVVEKRGSRSTVVWNPWIEKSQRMSDFGDDEWTGMCCVETAAIAPHEIVLAAGESHAIGTTHRVESV